MVSEYGCCLFRNICYNAFCPDPRGYPRGFFHVKICMCLRSYFLKRFNLENVRDKNNLIPDNSCTCILCLTAVSLPVRFVFGLRNAILFL